MVARRLSLSDLMVSLECVLLLNDLCWCLLTGVRRIAKLKLNGCVMNSELFTQIIVDSYKKRIINDSVRLDQVNR